MYNLFIPLQVFSKKNKCFLKLLENSCPTLKKADCKNTKVFISTQNKNINILKKIKLVKDRRCYFLAQANVTSFFIHANPSKAYF